MQSSSSFSSSPFAAAFAQQYWQQAQQHMQQMQQAWLSACAQAMPGASASLCAASAPSGSSHAAGVQLDSNAVQRAQQQYVQAMAQLLRESLSGQTPALPKDRRFADPAWTRNPIAAATAAAYALNAQALDALAQAVQADDKTRQRIRFAVEQWVAAAAPSNYWVTNPEAVQRALDSQGQSIQQGLQNLLHDIGQGHISMTDESQFEVGRNVATTEGAVVFENDLFQLIEYKPLTEQVHTRALLIVPPCINKFYILDLQPANSFVRYAVAQGHRTFVMSWRNPDASCAQLTWDDYIGRAVLRAIHVTQEISQSPQINTLGFCVGGTMLATALGVLAARGQTGDAGPVASATFLTTLVDFADTGILDIFIDENFVKMREAQMGTGGLLRGQELASTFSFLRPNELVWNYVVGNYLKGETPPAFDLLYWNSDATNLPGPWYTWYLRNLYLENKLKQPAALTVCGAPIDMRQVRVPMYFYGSREDHIVPVGSAYAATQVFEGEKCFVMGASGHIAGVINPPAKNKRSYWVRSDAALPATHAQWLEGAQEHAGSWWPHWTQWLSTHAGALQAAPSSYGHGEHQATEPAPGRYVRAKA